MQPAKMGTRLGGGFCGFDGELDDAVGFLLGEGGGFAGGAAGDEEGDAVFDLGADVRGEGGLVERAVGVEGSDERGAAALECHVDASLARIPVGGMIAGWFGVTWVGGVEGFGLLDDLFGWDEPEDGYEGDHA